jgi:hypothetical protein
MEHSIAQPVRHSSDPAPSLRATMASAVGGTVGQAIGSRLAAYGQEVIKKLRQTNS